MRLPLDRPAAAEAPAELLVLQRWEAFCGWFLEHTARWARSVRFTLTQRLQNHALDLLEALVCARYEPRVRARLLREANLTLERMRFLLRVACERRVMSRRGFATAMARIDETGRMLHGWRQSLGERRRRPRETAP